MLVLFLGGSACEGGISWRSSRRSGTLRMRVLVRSGGALGGFEASCFLGPDLLEAFSAPGTASLCAPSTLSEVSALSTSLGLCGFPSAVAASCVMASAPNRGVSSTGRCLHFTCAWLSEVKASSALMYYIPCAFYTRSRQGVHVVMLLLLSSV